MVTAQSLRVYIATRKPAERSQIEDALVLDMFDVRSFATAAELWEVFQQKPARLIITDRKFGDNFTGLNLATELRKRPAPPYVYIVMLSAMGRLNEIKEALAVSVDDYIVRPYNRFQIRSRILVAMRWLNRIDSLQAGSAPQR
jgi:DNA-binding response OmpR family regulator